MTHDEPLPERYADLLGPQPADDPALARLVADLDALHAAHEPPATLAAALDRAIRERAAGGSSTPAHTSGATAARPPQSSFRPPSKGRTPVTPRRLSTVLGGLAAVLVVGLMAALLLGGRGMLGVRPTLGLVGAPNGTPCGTATPSPASGWITSSGRATNTPPPTPTATPAGSTSSQQSGLIQNVVTATGVDNKLFPTGVTSQFPVNSDVYVVMAVQGVHAGEAHTISVRWFFQGQDLQLPPTAGTSITVSGDRQVFFSLVYPQPGAGMAKIYVDRPANDTSDASAVASIAFAVDMPSSAGATATATPIPLTPASCATPTDTATPGSSGVPTPFGTPTPTPPATPTPTPPHA